MTVYSDKFGQIATRLEALNGQAVTRHPGDGTADVPLTAWAFVETAVERRFASDGSERFVRVANLRFALGTVVDDRDTWLINLEDNWATVNVVIKTPSVRVFIERPVDRTVGGPALKDYTA